MERHDCQMMLKIIMRGRLCVVVTFLCSVVTLLCAVVTLICSVLNIIMFSSKLLGDVRDVALFSLPLVNRLNQT